LRTIFFLAAGIILCFSSHFEKREKNGLLIIMEIGDLVTVRLEETGTTRFLLPGIIFNKFEGEERTMYSVFTKGATVIVSDSDLGPIDLSLRMG